MFSPPRILKLSFLSNEGVLIIRVLLGPDFEPFEVVQFFNLAILIGFALHLSLGILSHFHNLVNFLFRIKRPLFPVAIKLFRFGSCASCTAFILLICCWTTLQSSVQCPGPCNLQYGLVQLGELLFLYFASAEDLAR